MTAVGFNGAECIVCKVRMWAYELEATPAPREGLGMWFAFLLLAGLMLWATGHMILR